MLCHGSMDAAGQRQSPLLVQTAAGMAVMPVCDLGHASMLLACALPCPASAPQEFTSWTKAAGFKSMQLIRLIGPNSAAVAYK